MINISSRELTFCFKIPVNGHYFIGVTVHFFKGFICDWMRSVQGLYIFYSPSLYEPFKPFQTIARIEIIYGSDEESGSFNNVQLEPNFHVGIGRTNLKNADIIDHTNSNCS